MSCETVLWAAHYCRKQSSKLDPSLQLPNIDSKMKTVMEFFLFFRGNGFFHHYEQRYMLILISCKRVWCWTIKKNWYISAKWNISKRLVSVVISIWYWDEKIITRKIKSILGLKTGFEIWKCLIFDGTAINGLQDFSVYLFGCERLSNFT